MREQVQRLNKAPGTEVQAGVLESGVTQTSKMGYVAQPKTSGQRMAETFGMLVGTGTKIAGKLVQDYNEKEAAFQTIEGNADGVKLGTDILNRAEGLPKEQRSIFIRNEIENNIAKMRDSDVSQSYLKSYLNSSTNILENY